MASLSKCTRGGAWLLEQHGDRIFHVSLKGLQPLSSEGAINYSMVAAEGDVHHAGLLEALL